MFKTFTKTLSFKTNWLQTPNKLLSMKCTVIMMFTCRITYNTLTSLSICLYICLSIYIYIYLPVCLLYSRDLILLRFWISNNIVINDENVFCKSNVDRLKVQISNSTRIVWNYRLLSKIQKSRIHT